MTTEIIGRAAVAPRANSVEQLLELLRQRVCSVTEIPGDRWDKARYFHPEIGIRGKTYTFAAGLVDNCFALDPALFSMSQAEMALLDPQQRMILQVAWRALEDAAIDFADLKEQRVGVYVGASSLDHGNLIVEDPARGGPHFMTGNTLSIVSNRISHVFGLNGPSMTIDTACSSSLVALDLALKALESGDIDLAIVGGVNALTHPLAFVGFAQARMLSPAGLCRSYDQDGIGYVRAEGCAVVVLRRSDAAERYGDRSHARILASGVNSSGRTNGISLPSAEAQAMLLRSLYEEGGIDPNRLAFIEGHGTGTRVGDPAEIWSIGTVIGKARRAPIPIGSIKSNIGHAEPASGLLGLIKAQLALENDFVPATLHFDKPNESIDFDGLNVHVASEPIELLHGKQPRLAGVNSFGFGGTNAHVVLSDPAPVARKSPDEAGGRLFVVSAQTESALASLLKSYRQTLKDAPTDGQARLIAATGANRPMLRHRFVAAIDTPSDILREIEANAAGQPGQRAETASALPSPGPIAFVFSGNGSQWAGMAVEAYRNDAAFRRRFDVIDALFDVHSDLGLTQLLLDPDLGSKLANTQIAQPLLFACQAALADVLARQGIKPAAVLGHSVGEIAASYVSGALALDDAVAVVAKRSLHQAALAGLGRMAALQLGVGPARTFCEKNGLDDLCVAGDNSPDSVTISGPSAGIEALKIAAQAARVPVQILDIDYPFHHPLIEGARDAFLADLTDLTVQPTKLPFISTVTGTQISGTELDANYWWRNVRDPVRFREATEAALDLGCRLFLEIGPRAILTSYLRSTIKQKAVAATPIASLTRDQQAAPREENGDPLGRIVARVVAHGGAFDRKALFGNRDPRIALPVLPFETIDLRHDFTSDAIDLYGRAEVPHTLAGWRVDAESGHWKNHIDAHLYPDLAEHVVDGQSILPGSGFLEIALSAARQFFGEPGTPALTIEVTDLQIVRPLVLSKTALQELSTEISRETGDVLIQSRERLSDDAWTLNATARCRRLSSQAPVPAERTERPGGEAASRVYNGEEAYATARRFHLDYGPRFRLLELARRVSAETIEVDLAASEKPAHRLLSYALDPVSVDAAFHGLVAIFGELSGEMDGAPFIPIRFGSARLYAADLAITRATITLKRVSAISLTAEFHLLSESGAVVAHLTDCRFRRTYLRMPKPLGALTFHQTTVPSPIRLTARPALVLPTPLFPPMIQDEQDNAVQMSEAAIFRACQDIALALASKGVEDGLLTAADLPEHDPLRRFALTCLAILAEAGMAERDGENWRIETGSPLPEVGVILSTLAKERPDSGTEIALLNHLHHGVLAHLGAGPLAEAGGKVFELPRSSDQSLAEIRDRSRLANARVDLLKTALAKAMTSSVAPRTTGAPGGAPGLVRIVELCAVSPQITAELALFATDAGVAFAVCEPRKALREDLTLAFDGNPDIAVVAPSELDGIGVIDLLVSASDDLAMLLKSAETLRRAVERQLERGVGLGAAVSAPSLLLDFALGLAGDDNATALAPMAHVTGVDEWHAVFAGMGRDDAVVTSHQLVHGSIISVEIAGRADAAEDEAMKAAPLQDAAASETSATDHAGRTVLIIDAGDLDAGSVRVGSLGDTNTVSMSLTDLAKDGTSLARRLARTGGDVDLVVLAGRCGKTSGADRLQINMGQLAALAQALALVAADPASTATPRLGVVLSAGAPVAQGSPGQQARPNEAAVSSATDDDRVCDTGLWGYLRVLRNEFAGLDVHAIQDLSGAATNREDASLAAALTLMRSGSDNREWAIDPETGSVSELRIVAGPCPAAERQTRDYEAATIRQRIPSQIASIAWESTARLEPADGEIVIAVEATGLNFRDVMWSMGLLPEEALEDGFAGATIGMECAGLVAAVGPGVDDLRVGDKVMAAATAAFSTHVRVKRFAAAKIPEAIDIAAGATLPVAFLTAYYALVEIGGLAAGERVLIHGGAGGVGLAALQIAKARGATVFATAGSDEKRRLLTMLGADHVFNSRDLGFVDAIGTMTAGLGVDVVLNSLFGEAMERSLGLVKPFGRFLELGKRDFYADSKIGLRPFRRNVSYFGIDLDQLLEGRPEVSRRLFADVSALFESGALTPLPYRVFSHDETTQAFRLMQASGHIGKIVVTPPRPGVDRVARALPPATPAASDGVHLVVGGIGGFGLAAAGWLVQRGARRLALVSRRGVADDATMAAVAEWKTRGVTVSLHACDATERKAVEALLCELRAESPLRSVVHAAMVLDDGLITNATREGDQRVVDTKAKAAAILDEATSGDALEAFILFSSATTLIGNPGQANYVAANGYLEGLARARRTRGLPALAVQFGAITDAGYLARNAEVGDLLAKRIGATGMTATRALALLGEVIAADPGTVEAAVVAVAEIDWTMASQLRTVASPLFAVAAGAMNGQTSGLDGGELDLAEMIAGRSPQEAEKMLFDLVAGGIATTLRVPVSDITRTKGIRDLGLDSLMAMEVSMNFRQKTGFDLPLSNITQATTVGDMAHSLYAKLARADDAADDTSKASGQADAAMIEDLASRHSGTAGVRS